MARLPNLQRMSDKPENRCFVQIADAIRETNPWTNNEWLCRPDLVAADNLLLVRANMAPEHCHPFHYHPHREEIIYVIYGRAEQWVGGEYRVTYAGGQDVQSRGVEGGQGTSDPQKGYLYFWG